MIRYLGWVFCFLALNIASVWAQTSVEITNVTGTVEICKAGQVEYAPAETGTLLEAGDKIKTRDDSSAEIAFDENEKNTVRLEADSSAAMLLQEEEKIDLLEGRVFSSIEDLPAGSAFQIRTPTAIAGVRGTDWETAIEEEGTVVEALEGQPFVQGIDKEGKLMKEKVFIMPGYRARVQRFQAPSGIMEEVPQEKIRKWKDLKNEIRGRAKDAIIRRKELRNLRGIEVPGGMPQKRLNEQGGQEKKLNEQGQASRQRGRKK